MKPRNKVEWSLYGLYWVLAGGVIAALAGISDAHAAKMRVHWVAPTANNDGSPLTDLTGFRVEWGTCDANGAWLTYQAGFNVPNPAATDAWIYPTGLTIVCARVFAINSKNQLSDSSNVAAAYTPVQLGKPVH